ncbi:hypothetical protein B5C34_13760 [Pacificimonas flava]|uniref:Uncharacterized protein n=2 Tax=Pacificimonas TaxID=1960290 RepID=A0A219B9C0_9SPHN|nr:MULTISPECIES: hypothetical protein [Pacificimonas]MBZ6379891.1 hypothetical protein [Pacificimonas aurantium]OWV34419.1 hypothetical protein B5C34_13760 [Pacificimonas flava]
MSEMTPVAIEGALTCDYAGETAVGLLDALIDSMTMMRPGRDAARLATELHRLADGAAFVAQELETLMAGNAADAAARLSEQSDTLPSLAAN